MEKVNRRQALWAGLATFSITLLVYLLTMPQDLTWAHYGGDGGELITASLTLGVPHPPGYPTYVILGRLFALLPWGTAVFKYHLFSATAVALAAAILTQTSRAFPSPSIQPLTAISAGLLFAFAPLVWSQAIIAEVYGLNLLLVSLFLWALLTKRPSWSAGLFLGLAVTTHLTSLIFAPVALVLTPVSHWKRLVGFFLLGLLPFLLLPLLAQGNSPIVWGNPTTIQGWWWLVSGAIYQPNQFAFTDFSVVAKAQEWGRIFATQISWAGYFLLIIGLIVAFQPRSDRYVRWQMGMLLATAVSILFYAFATNTIDSVVLTLPAILIICLLLVPALKLFKWFALALPLLLLLLNFSTMNLRHDPGIRPYAEQLLSDLPANAIVITDGDPALFALWYLHISEGQRPDIAIVDNHLFAFDWYRERLHQTYPDLIVPQADDLEKLQTEQVQERPFCHVNITAEAKPVIINSCAKH